MWLKALRLHVKMSSIRIIRPCVWRRWSSIKSTSAIQLAGLDYKGISARRDEMRESLRRRGYNSDIIDDLDHWRGLQALYQRQREEIIQSRKKAEVLLRQKSESEASTESLDVAKSEAKKHKQLLQSIDKSKNEATEKMHSLAEALPNWLDPTVPQDPNQPEIVHIINGETEQSIEDQLPQMQISHKDIGVNLGLMNFTVPSRISGSSWYYLTGDGALLEQALVQFALSKARKAGYQMVTPPSIVKQEIANACGFKPKDHNGEKQVYNIENEPLCLTGTAEIPLGALHSSSTMQPKQWPVKYVGVSRSYRAEAGANGRDSGGLYRVHEFTKVELFHFTTPEKSAAELDNLRDFQASIIKDLGIKARMLNMPTLDLGAPAMKKFDCEAWMPGRKSWGELTSCSNCGDYQSRRLGIRFRPRPHEKTEFVHTLNGTAMAVPRVIVALIEQNYDAKTKSILIPEVLRPYMDGKETITENTSICI